MPLGGRMLIGFTGQLPNDALVRYAAMVARVQQPMTRRNGRANSGKAHRRSKLSLLHTPLDRRRQRSWQSAENVPSRGGTSEIRFVSLLPCGEIAGPSSRAELAAKVEYHFANLPKCGPVQVDLLKGRALTRLTALAADFDTDLLLLDIAADARARCARFAVQASCAVWLVPPDWAPVLRRILVPINFSCDSATSLKAAVDLASHFQPAKCIALYVDGHDGRFGDNTPTPARCRELIDQFHALLATIDTRGVRIEPLFVKSNHLDRAIEQAATEHAIDLTVMICRRRGRLAAAIHASVAQSVIRESRNPILLLKSAAGKLEILEAMQLSWRSADISQFS